MKNLFVILFILSFSRSETFAQNGQGLKLHFINSNYPDTAASDEFKSKKVGDTVFVCRSERNLVWRLVPHYMEHIRKESKGIWTYYYTDEGKERVVNIYTWFALAVITE